MIQYLSWETDDAKNEWIYDFTLIPFWWDLGGGDKMENKTLLRKIGPEFSDTLSSSCSVYQGLLL